MTTTSTTAATPSPISSPRPLRAAKQRTSAGPIGWVGPVLAVLLTLLGLVLLRDGIFAPGGTTGWPGAQSSWTGTATTGLNGLSRTWWVSIIGVVLALLGLYLLGVALRRRTRRALALTGASGAHLMVSDVARRAGAAAGDVDGVLHATATATRRRVTVSVTTTGGSGGAGSGVQDQVASAVTESLSALVSPPSVRVRTTTTNDPDGKDPA